MSSDLARVPCGRMGHAPGKNLTCKICGNWYCCALHFCTASCVVCRVLAGSFSLFFYSHTFPFVLKISTTSSFHVRPSRPRPADKFSPAPVRLTSTCSCSRFSSIGVPAAPRVLLPASCSRRPALPRLPTRRPFILSASPPSRHPPPCPYSVPN